jgi:hypothetical protein
LEQWGRVNARRESEIFAADLAESLCIAEIRLLADYRARDFHLNVHIFLRYPHDRSPLVEWMFLGQVFHQPLYPFSG